MKEKFKSKLTPKQYQICCEKKTEPPFKNKYWNHKEKGTYLCVCCEKELFSSDDKFDSNSGWPSFTKPIDNHTLSELEDKNFDMIRTEVICKNCESHLGHVFTDGPPPSHLRYCINSEALIFKKVN